MHLHHLTLLQACFSPAFSSCHLLSLHLMRFPEILGRTMLTFHSCPFWFASSYTTVLGISWTAIPCLFLLQWIKFGWPIGFPLLLVVAPLSWPCPLFDLTSLVPGGLIQNAFLSQSYIPHQPQGLLAFRSHSSGTPAPNPPSVSYSPPLQVLPVLCPCCPWYTRGERASKRSTQKKPRAKLMNFLLSISQIPSSLLP